MRSVFIVLLSSISFLGAAQIKVDVEKDVDFHKFKTFRIEQGQVVYQSNEKKKDEKKIFAILKDALTKELTLRGYSLASDSLAELSVSYVYQERGVAIGGNPGPLGQTPISDPASVNPNERPTSVDTDILILDVAQVKGKNSLWTATCTVSDMGQDLSKTLDATVVAAFKKFPVKHKKR